MTVTVGPLQQSDVPAADEIFRAAFAQFLGIPDPSAFTGDAAIVATRWHAYPELALGAASSSPASIRRAIKLTAR